MKNILKKISILSAGALMLAFLQGCDCWDWQPCCPKKECKPKCEPKCKPKCEPKCKPKCDPCAM